LTWDLKLLRTTQKAADAVQRALFNRHMIAAWTSADEPRSTRAPLAPHQSA
jgi:hypothetical protein